MKVEDYLGNLQDATNEANVRLGNVGSSLDRMEKSVNKIAGTLADILTVLRRIEHKE